MTTRREAIIHALKDTLRITLIEEFGEILSARITEENMASTADAILAVRLDEAVIRKDEREKQREIDAKIAEHDDRQGEWPKSVDVSKTSPTRLMQTAIATAIRNGGKQP